MIFSKNQEEKRQSEHGRHILHNSGPAKISDSDESPSRAVEIHVQGIVQGVGFRPFVYRLACREGVAGTVCNTGQGVIIRAWGTEEQLAALVRALRQEIPPLARIDRFTVHPLRQTGPETGFTIVTSRNEGRTATLVSPDTAVCRDCLAEISDPADRRFDYPFTNCTNCGPRLTIIRRMPYDRPNTSMARFTMCPECRREYHDPADRRFHAQPNGCPACGPRLSWHDRHGRLLCRDNREVLDDCATALARGSIVAIRGLGGFHLAADATSAEAVRRLRERKGRYHKPLAVMAADLEAVRQIAVVSGPEQEALTSPCHPIVLLTKNRDLTDAGIAPRLGEIGVMLPYTPLHHLLFQRPGCPRWLVMTSGNRSGEAICTGNEEALGRLAGIADFFLLHDREIVTRVDDSVVRVAGGALRVLRRSRGYVPDPVPVSAYAHGLLGCGAELKNTFCLGRDSDGFPGQHIGDLNNPETLAFFEESIQVFQRLLDVEISGVACDLHPDYLSSRHGRGLGLPLVRVQHHHAHGAAVMAEHGLERALAVVFDGAGLGGDGTVWGGEILRIDRTGFHRLAHLLPVALPGGDQAARRIWRMALSLALVADLPNLPDLLPDLEPEKTDLVARMISRGINSPRTSSCGRLFDGVAALLGIRTEVMYEAQAAMELETLARQAPDDRSRYRVALREEHGRLILDSRPMLRQLAADRHAGRPVPLIGRDFHLWLAEITTRALQRLRTRTGEDTVVLAGGCFQNRLLLELFLSSLETRGFSVFTGCRVPVNDASIGLGQVAVAAWQRTARR